MYRIKNGVELPNTFKLKVSSVDQNRAIQECLISLGFIGVNGRAEAYGVGNTYIYSNDFGISTDSDHHKFYKNRNAQIHIEHYFKKVDTSDDTQTDSEPQSDGEHLTDDHKAMLVYFWQEKQDITRYSEYPKIKHLIKKDWPELHKAWKCYKKALKYFDDVLK